MRCSHCDMLLSPTGTSCPRCGTTVADGKKQGVSAFAFAQAGLEQKSGSAGTAAEGAPLQHDWELHASNDQDTPFSLAPTPPHTPLPYEQEDDQNSTSRPTASALPVPFPKTSYRSKHFGFGLAGLCLGIACLLLVSVYTIAQTLPQTSNPSSPRSTNSSSATAHNTNGINLSSKSATAVVPTATYSGSRYISNAQTAVAIDFANNQPTLPTNTFRVGQKIYITFKVLPDGQTGAVCLLWYINAAQFASYPFAINSTTTTTAYSYASSGSVGQGYVQIYWETTPSCTDPTKILGASVNFSIID